jgi:hypothetical protein
MKTFAPLLSAAVLAVTATGCGLLGNNNEVYTYEADPQEFAQDVSQAFNNQTGMFPEVDCTADETLCSTIPTQLPPSASVACEAAASGSTKHCVLHYDLTIHQTVDLSKQASFPSAVANSPVVDLVTVDEVRYWTSSPQTLTVATPPLDIYVGPNTAMSATDSGVQKLGTMGSIPAGMPPSAAPDCKKGAATGKDTACDLALTEAGQTLLSTLAKSFKTPFNVIVVGHLTIAGGEPLPGGKLDAFVQPVIGFHLPL